MKFKEKHIHQLFGSLLLSTAMLLPTGCTQNSKTQDKEKQQSGLLDDTPIRTNDKYGSEIVLYPVNVPVYNKDGERKEGQFILTRGIKNSDFHAAGQTLIRRTFLNDSHASCYVMAVYCGNNHYAICTEDGFSGLFIDEDNKVVFIADENITELSKEKNKNFTAKNIQNNSQSQQNSNKEKTTKSFADSIPQINFKADSLAGDSVIHINISPIPEPTSNNQDISDSLLLKNQNVRE